jgi:hypothetical protein
LLFFLISGFVRIIINVLDADIPGEVGTSGTAIGDAEPFCTIFTPGADSTALS